MEHATSADGTRIAFDRHGDGDPVVIVGGAMSTAAAGTPLAEALPESELLIVPESQNHGLDPVGTAREVLMRLTARE
ncbi:hypothetical protein [Microbacterium sp.]|uniref:hypothetical protein n=1 Tax=Microbacterium sp. TaxID=51671 RepID=UPI003F9D8A45